MNKSYKLQIAKKNVEGLYATKKLILKEAYNRNFNWWVDILDIEKYGCVRKRIEMSFKEIMKYFKNDSLFSFITQNASYMYSAHIEICFVTLEHAESYYLWILVDLKHLDYFVDKYKLKEV